MSLSDAVVSSPAPTGAGAFSTPPHLAARHLLGLEGLGRETLLELIEESARERDWLRSGAPNRDDLAGCTVLLAFIEDSTRTRTSFEIAARRLGANALTFSASASSLNKGESLLDTMRLFEAMGAQLLVIRHAMSGAPGYLARHLPRVGVLNAGDGMHEHPTQGLLDLLTLHDAWHGRFEDRRLAIVGDVAHSRVARSALAGLNALGVHVTVCGPGTLLPADVELLGCDVAPTVEDAMTGADGVMALRIQKERMEKGLLPSLVEYAREWGIQPARVALMKPGAVVMHPGPVNRGVELDPVVADSAESVILAQVENGVAARCAVLKRCWTAWKEAA
jgi:aspartate carbamoyltransferase catalytic subunit